MRTRMPPRVRIRVAHSICPLPHFQTPPQQLRSLAPIIINQFNTLQARHVSTYQSLKLPICLPIQPYTNLDITHARHCSPTRYRQPPTRFSSNPTLHHSQYQRLTLASITSKGSHLTYVGHGARLPFARKPRPSDIVCSACGESSYARTSRRPRCSG